MKPFWFVIPESALILRAQMISIMASAFVCAAIPASAQIQDKLPANHLISSADPYLLQHAHNPVDWYPWGEEAIAKAKKENKPIFVSIGYSTCYWCHVAERTIYSDPSIAALMNQSFVNIKVDREERPDIDETYMLARQMLTGSGGWPNNVFLTPDLKPFYAGSYFPPQDQGNNPGFPSVLRRISEKWKSSPAELTVIADKTYVALNRLRDSLSIKVSTVAPANWLTIVRDRMLAQRDRVFGGFGGSDGTKFPQSPVLSMLLADYRLNGTTASLETVADALDAIAFGGIHDQLAGGIHRYSTEPTWSAPHFEKMLYDNAQLIGLYANLYAISREPLAREMAIDIVEYLNRRMKAPNGAFYNAEDAEAEGKEGESYLWSRDEIAELLGSPGAERFFALYELTPLPGAAKGEGILRIRSDRTANKDRLKLITDLADLAPFRAKLMVARDRRPQPIRDEKIAVAANALAIGALAHAGSVFDKPDWVAMAKRAGEFLWQSAFDEKTGRLRHQLYRGDARGEGFLDDYAFLALAFLAISDASGEAIWPLRAHALASAMVDRFFKPDGNIVTAMPDATLIIPAVDLQENDTPSGTSAAYSLLARLGKIEPRYAALAETILTSVAPKVKALPIGWASLAASAAQFLAAPLILNSAAHVKVAAHSQSVGDHDEIVMQITIDPEYHVNANPASMDELIATKVSVPGMPDVKIAYPKGQIFRPKFLPEEILVYEGSLAIKIEGPAGALNSPNGTSINLEVQACDLQSCLPPSTIPVKVHRGNI